MVASPSAFHAAHEVARHLGFPRQLEQDNFDASVGGHTIIRGGAVVSYVIPPNPRGVRIIGAHTDSPGLMLKPRPDYQAFGFDQVGVEVYGGPILESFFDRELTVAGRVVLLDGTEHLVSTGPALRLANLAIHLGREDIDRQAHLSPISLVGPIMEAVAGELGVEVTDIAGHELITVDAQPAAITGDVVTSARLDNLSSVFAGMIALERAARDVGELDDVVVLAAFNHEEVGSASAQGAAGSLLEDLLYRLAGALGKDPRQLIAASSCVSADAAHSIHPNYPHKHDPQHRPVLGAGPVTKVNANQRYASDAATIALWERASAGIDHQVFVSNNSVRCGSTIGPITATRLGIPTVDVGVPLLSMHSAREMMSLRDEISLIDALEAYLTS
ncbi:aspartyl aminopeptidase [Corynebacterium uterequi]|uniref:M18 family aminopeptidase n=1 Tax=Corynebacterium uterequi TaxID=1072256 RepID=A0A0G3HGM2_9CORY|nr:aspartyl aminopeptidase [Corynebacterium uterequi]